MAENPRIEELRRRVSKDPTSIAFAQLAEEYRRSGRFQEAIEACESGLTHHPGYLSARVTLGRSLLETGQLDAAQQELQQVLRAAPENLAGLRGLAEVHHRRGDLREALTYYRQALDFSRHDLELEHIVEEIRKEIEPSTAGPTVVDGLSFEDVKNTFMNLSLGQPLPGAEAESAPGAEPQAPGPVAQAAPEPAAASLEAAVEVAPFAALDVVPEVSAELEAVAGEAVDVAPEAPELEPVVAVEPEPESARPAASAAFDAASAAFDAASAEAEAIAEILRPDAETRLEAPALEAALDLAADTSEPGAMAPRTEPEPTSAMAEGAAPAAEPAPEAPPADPQIDELQRWLDSIMSERSRRAD